MGIAIFCLLKSKQIICILGKFRCKHVYDIEYKFKYSFALSHKNFGEIDYRCLFSGHFSNYKSSYFTFQQFFQVEGRCEKSPNKLIIASALNLNIIFYSKKCITLVGQNLNTKKALQKAASSVFCSFAKFETWPVKKFLNLLKILC